VTATPSGRRRIRRNFAKVWKRDGAICQYCGAVGTEVDHIVPYSWARDNSMENLVVACRDCNARAGNQMFDSFEDKQYFLLTEKERRKH
jgi:5-methylcytosine-specific restriction endonuclease McrA